MYNNIAKVELVSWNLELQKMDKKLNICCKYYLPPYFLCLDVDILAFLVSTGLNCSWVSRCACYYPYAKMCSFCWFCLLIYSNSHFQRPASSLERKSGRITSSSIISMGTAGRLHTCDLDCQGASSCPGVFLLPLFSPAMQCVVVEEMFSFLSTQQCQSAGKSRFTDLGDSVAVLSLMTPESAGLRCQEVLTCTVYHYFPGGITATWHVVPSSSAHSQVCLTC